ncbi:MAG: archaemetzincin [Planctomycetota bacterium]
MYDVSARAELPGVLQVGRFRFLLFCGLGVACLVTLAMRVFDFQSVSAADRAEAVGKTGRLPGVLKRAFNSEDPLFDPIPKPKPSDWLAQHHEAGQTFTQYVRSRPNRPDTRRSTLYLLPVGEFDARSSPDLEQVARFAGSFFMMPVKTLEPVDEDGLPVTRRDNGGVEQMLTTDLLNWLKPRVPQDAYCLLAVTMTDLYPDPKWNYVFGQATLSDRVGVYSFARYAPEFWGEETTESTKRQMLWRSCAVLAHETGHMFGIRHCIHFHCLMNGANNLQEFDSHPLHLCPVCLRKLHHAAEFDVAQRYERLRDFAASANWSGDQDWLTLRLKRLGGRPLSSANAVSGSD